MRAESTPLSNLEGNDSDVFSTKLADSKTGSGKRKIANILSTHIVDFYQVKSYFLLLGPENQWCLEMYF